MMKRILPLVFLNLFLLVVNTHSLSAQTIAEKKAGGYQGQQDMTPEMQQYLIEVNREIRTAQDELSLLYAQVHKLYADNAPSEAFHQLLDEININRERIVALQNNWREMSVRAGYIENYALWHQPETTIGQLVMDYGSHDYVYLLSPEIGSIKLSVASNLLIPRASWEEMLDLILVQNGIGFKQLNPFLRELFLIKENRSGIKLITNKRHDLDIYSPESRVSFVLTPEPAEVRRTWSFLEKFVNPNSTVLQQIGRDILIVGPIPEIKDLLKLYDFISANKGEKEYKIIPVSRVDTEEMARILAAIFDQEEISSKPFNPLQRDKGPVRPKPPSSPPFPMPGSITNRPPDIIETNGLKIIPLPNVARSLFLVGTKEEIRKAEQIIRQVESQVGEARERVIYWYTARHSDPEELADVLARIYLLMIRKGVGFGPGMGIPNPLELQAIPSPTEIASEIVSKERDLLPAELYQTSYYQQGNYVVNPAPIEPKRTRNPGTTSNRDNFIVDPKSGSIAMVIEADILPKIKELIKKLDVPKRMVQIEALLFERRLTKQNNFGLNLLKIGDCASNEDFDCFSFNDPLTTPSGIVDFILSRATSCHLPAYDIAYRFLMSQDDVQINDSPSVVAINQTPATIAIVDEISINTGIYNVETAKGNTLERAFTRAQYGITIDITPTIHITEEEGEYPDEPNYVTLETDLTFDSIQTGGNPQRPDVTRRHINNQVRVPDGQTVILGGLRRKDTDDFKEAIPFFGELPAIGKFFSQTKLADREVEMFIFLTPTIISDPLDDFERIKCEEMRRRPGDIPEFMCSLVEARVIEKNRALANSMEIIFGQDLGRCYSPGYWRPSTCAGSPPRQWAVNYTMQCGDDFPGCGEYDGR